MLLGKSGDSMIEASPNGKAVCPVCNEELIPKCGEINIWHWAHKHKIDCDSWAESETQWHLGWKRLFPQSQIEQVIVKDGVKHRADVLTKTGTVIEFQHSPISPQEIRERERFYQKVIWVFDIRYLFNEAPANEFFSESFEFFDKDEKTLFFNWKHRKKYIAFVKKAALDIGFDNIFIIQKMPTRYEYGVGLFYQKQQFISYLMRL